MADKKYRVTNPNNHHVGVVFLNGIERDIPPKGFVMATADDIAYWESTTALFRKKHLTFNDKELVEDLGMNNTDLKIESDEEILKKLNTGTLAALKKYLESVNELHIRKRIVDLAKQGDLKASRLKLIQEVFETEIID